MTQRHPSKREEQKINRQYVAEQEKPDLPGPVAIADPEPIAAPKPKATKKKAKKARKRVNG